MPEQQPANEVSLEIDGRPVGAASGELLIAAAEAAGVYIPRFCWHPRLRTVAMCRMCLVEVEGMRGLQPACYVPVRDGMVVRTETPEVRKAQEGVLEFLLINHPLDCPVCDRGGECPLQDHVMSFGPGESRFVEDKRHFEKPVSISDLVLLDRERCIQCSRCTRFAQEVAGDSLIDFGARGNALQIITFPDDPFASYFSGNTVQICPVGALTATPYRFKARPWDVTVAETTCTGCSVGCRGALSETRNQPLRLLGVDTESVSWGWLCDKGRFGYEAVASENRLQTPFVLKNDEFVEVSWAEAIDGVASRVGDAIEVGGRRVAAIGGARLANEEAYALSKFMRMVCGTNDLDCQLDDGLPATFVAGARNRAAIGDLSGATAIVLAAPDLKEELPVLYLRVRDAVVNQGVPLFVAGEPQSGLSPLATRVWPSAADVDPDSLPGGGEEGEDGGPIVVVVGRQSLTQDAGAHASWALSLQDRLGDNARLLPVLRRSNAHGAIDMGVTPELLPGRVAVDDAGGREVLASVWEGTIPTEVGRTTRDILEVAAAGAVDVLFIVGADPITDFPDPDLARRAIERVGCVVVSDLFVTPTVDAADVVLPAAGWGEVAGTVTNLEGRVQRVAAKVVGPGQSASDTHVFREVAERLGVDFGCGTPEATMREIARVAPAYAGIKPSSFRGRLGREGVLVPEGRVPPTVDAVPAGPLPPPGDGRFRLHVGRSLYDRGTLVSNCPSLSGLLPGPIARVNPDDLEGAGLSDGDKVVVRGTGASSTLSLKRTVAADRRVAPGTVSVPFNQDEPFAVPTEAVVVLERTR